ncbi:MAG: glyoxylate carboligase [Mycobacterium sp.]|uniref:thiamine pyrophosphate-binding protein n=1 Tax=Mycobacterium sp. TaxID=1785 RepID=UPI0026299813|nr:thiamine pyrophosphate-binding protein [Mycobacterium sp.]MCW2659860.1 glyoxylate carboligase [Mycobacterium sp.]
MRVYEAIVKGLESIDVEAAFGGAGENAAQLLLALKHSPKIRGIVARHEQAASFMACGYSMYTNKLGVCFATAGPGAFNLFSGLAVAMSDSYPVLAISGYAAMQWAGRGSLNETSGLNNTPDSRAMFAATTKKSWLLTNINDTCDVLEEAVNEAFRGRPGPVHIHVPEDLTHEELPDEKYHDIRLDYRPPQPDAASVEQIATALADALNNNRKVAVLAGFGAVRSGAYAEVKHFIERFQIPLLTTLDGKGIVSEAHPLSVGLFCDSGHSSAWKSFLEADVVLAVGNAFNQHATFNYYEGLFDGKTLIHINISATEIDKAYKADYALVSDARPAIAAIHAALDVKVGEVARIGVLGRDWEARRIPHLTGKIHPGQLAQSIGRHLPPRGILLADAGAHLAWLGYYVELEEGQNFRKAGEFGPMAGHVNGAIGLKLANPDRTVVVGCGDGCYQLAGFDLMTAVEHNIPVIWVIFNDSEFKLIKIYQLETYFESGLVEFQNPDFAAHARACGADGYTVDSLDKFEDAFRAALSSGRPSVIDAHITRWAVPHYSPSPKGVIHGIAETIEERLRNR